MKKFNYSLGIATLLLSASSLHINSAVIMPKAIEEYNAIESGKRICNENVRSTVDNLILENDMDCKEPEEITKSFGQITNASDLYLKEKNKENSESIIELHDGMTFKIEFKVNDWYLVTFDEYRGYINASNVIEFDNYDNPPYDKYTPSRGDKIKEESYACINVELTGYCNCSYCCDSCTGITATGSQTHVGTIAAPSNIEFGTKVFIPDLSFYKEDGIFVVEDRGGAINVKSDGTHIIDVWFPSHQDALNFGRKKTVMYILD